jgi:hypothetical protein
MKESVMPMTPQMKILNFNYYYYLIVCRMGSSGTDSHMWLTRQGKLSLPVYLNSTRTELLFTVDLNIAPGQDQHSFYERGVAVLTSTALN